MSLAIALSLAVAGATPACAQDDTTAPCLDRRPAASDWRQLATSRDRERLRNWRDGWDAALTAVRAGGQAQAAGYGPLLQPDVALAGAWPAAGDYLCRTVKLGAKAPGGAALVAYPPVACLIDADGDTLRFTVTAGAQRPAGRILRDEDARAVFLGTLELGDETTPLAYGQDPLRDMAGLVQRLDARRWRIVLPYPAFESTLDVIELTPA